MASIISRAAWGARPASPANNFVGWPSRTGFCVHHSGARADQSVQEIQNFHMRPVSQGGRGWRDIGYNFLIRSNGSIYEGRGWTGEGAHVTGHNTATIGVCVIGNYDNDPVPAAVKSALAWLYAEAQRRKGRSLTLTTHGKLASTACPGKHLSAVVAAGFGSAPVTPPSPKPTKPAVRPAPGPNYAFPLPSGHYFGPASGPAQSVSGRYSRAFKGVDAKVHLKRLTQQLEKRGWDARKGGRYLTRYGHDGTYGPEVEALVRAFQRDQGLSVDGLAGPQTWRAAFNNPVTG